jgi:DNA-binding IclR family transcriptional regulator
MINELADGELTRIRMEFVEMPDLKLTLQQASRLWNLPDSQCDRMLHTLVDGLFLIQTESGAFIRRR